MRQLCAAVALGLLTAGAAQAASQQAGPRVAVEISGSQSRNRADGYQLAISYSGHKSLTPDAIAVYAEPSHTLLLAHVNALSKDRDALIQKMTSAGALTVTTGSDLDFRHLLTLPYNPGWTDQRISVVLRSGQSELLLSSAAIDVGSFHVVSTVTFSNTPTGPVPLAYNHCCSGHRCGQMCIDCPGASFFCDLINCTIECVDF